MEPKFTGPSYTIGIEEELMILDSESLALANAIEALLEEYGEDGDVKPELLESVLEIATAPAPEHARRRAASCARCAAQVAEAAARRGLRDRLGRHAPVRDVGGPADRRRARATAS